MPTIRVERDPVADWPARGQKVDLYVAGVRTRLSEGVGELPTPTGEVRLALARSWASDGTRSDVFAGSLAQDDVVVLRWRGVLLGDPGTGILVVTQIAGPTLVAVPPGHERLWQRWQPAWLLPAWVLLYALAGALGSAAGMWAEMVFIAVLVGLGWSATWALRRRRERRMAALTAVPRSTPAGG